MGNPCFKRLRASSALNLGFLDLFSSSTSAKCVVRRVYSSTEAMTSIGKYSNGTANALTSASLLLSRWSSTEWPNIMRLNE